MTHRSDLVVWIASLLLIIAALSTPVVPYEYDAAGWWIPRAEWEREEAGAVIGLLRTPETLSLLQPWLGLHRHPTAAPIIVGALGRLAPASFPIVRVAALWNAALLILVLVGLRRRLDSDDTPAMLLAVGVIACPFVFVHLRAGYVDLSVGAVGALLAIALSDLRWSAPRRFAWLRLVVIASLLVQLKLEGPLHAISALVAVNLCSATPFRRRWTVAGILIAVVVLNLAVWQFTLRLSPAAAARPALFVWNTFHPGLLVDYAYHLVRHAIDFTTWGLVWPIVLGIALATRRWAAMVSLVITLGMLGVTFAGGPPLMMVWAAQGIQLNRLLLQALIAALPFLVGIRLPGATASPPIVPKHPAGVGV